MTVAVTGCGESFATVTGTVTLDGKSVDAGTVTFTPTSGPAIAKEIINGAYQVDRVPLGNAGVSVIGPPDVKNEADRGMAQKLGKAPPPPPPPATKIPLKYADPATSGLKYTVKRGDNSYKIELSSK